MSVKMKFGSKDIPFVYKGNKLVYPNPIKDGLLLWYDFKGMRNTDTNKEVAKDLSGNGNDGTLTNFNFTEGSGYKDNTLVFDGVDDRLTTPELVLDETAMSVVHDGKIYAYEDDKVVTVGEDGEITNIPKNILVGSDLSNVRPRSTITLLSSYSKGDEIIVRSEKRESDGTTTVFGFENRPNKTSFIEGEDITLSFEARGNVRLNYVFLMRPSGGNNNLYLNTDGINEQEFKRFSTTTKAPFTTDSGYILFASTQGLGGESWFEIKSPKLERGVGTTQWIRNPKDYQTTTLSPASLTDLQLYNKTLRKDELLHNAESKGLKKLKPGVPVQDGLVLHYDFSHESNTSEYKDKAFDYSGNGNHGVLNNFNFTEESGYDGNKLKFDGVDDYITTQGNFPSSQNLTIETVFIAADYATTQGLGGITKGNIGGWANNEWGFRDVGNSHSLFYSKGNSVQQLNVPRQAGVVTHYTCIISNELLEIYRNGVRINWAKREAPMRSTTQELEVGRAYTNNLASHSYNSVKIYNRALTAEEIAHNYEIEKERFGITTDNSLPIGKAIIGKTNKVGGDK